MKINFKSNISRSTLGALKNTQWLLLEKAVSLPVALLINVIITRYLGVEQSGEYHYILSLIAIVAPLSVAGLAGLVTRQLVEHPENTSTILGTALIGRVIGCALSLLLILCFTFFSSYEHINWLLIVGAANLFTCFTIFDFWFQAKVDSKMAVLSRLCVLALMTVVKLVIVINDLGLERLVFAYGIELVLTGVMLLAFYFFRQKELKFKVDFRLLFSLLRRSSWLILSGFAAAIYLKIDQIMLGDMVGNAAVGIYAAASRLSEIWYFLPEAIVTSFFPSLLKLKQTDEQGYSEKLQRLCDILLLIALSIVIPVIMCATPVVTLLYGEDFSPSGTVLKIHIFAGLFVFMRSLFSKWLIAEDLLKFSLISHGTGALVNVGLNMLLIPQYHEVGAALATVISYAFASYIALFFFQSTRPMAWVMTRSLLFVFRFKQIVRSMS